MVFLMRHRKPIYHISWILILACLFLFFRKIYLSSFSNVLPSSEPFQKTTKATNISNLLHQNNNKKFENGKENLQQNDFFQRLKNDPHPKSFPGDHGELHKIKLTEFELLSKLHNLSGGVSESPIDFNDVEICVNDSQCFPFNEYATWKSQRIHNITNKHLMLNRSQPTLRPYPEDIPRPDPLILLKGTTMSIDLELIKNNLQAEKRRRMDLGDDDLLEIPVVRNALFYKKHIAIPNIVHFVWFGCRNYKFHHYVSMLSALRYQQPDLILLHTNCVPSGNYWDYFVNAAGKTLLIVKRSPPLDVFGNTFKLVEYQSDVARLQILLEVGGIYLDDDVYVLKSLDDLRVHEMVLGEENYDALANSIIMASKDAWFLHRWYQEYQYFNDSIWSYFSCFVPWAMWRLFPSTIIIVKEKMLRPNWQELEYTYLLLWDWRKSYTIHLYSRFLKKIDGVEERTIDQIAVLNTTYGEISRHVIWGDYHIREGLEFLQWRDI